MDLADIEGDAHALYRMAGMDPADPPGIGRLVEALLRTRVQVATIRAHAQLAQVNGLWRIYVRKGTPATRMRFDVGHELAHWYYRQCGYFGEDIEQRCDAMSAAIIAPREFFQSIRRRIVDVRDVADALGSTQSLAALREGEVLGTPVALVQPQRVRIRGDEWAWPTEAELRKFARIGHASLQKIPITDEPGRIVIVGTS